MPECSNCGSHVTEDYVRVFGQDGADTVDVCPSCPDKIRGSDGKVRDARSTRRNDTGEDVDHSRDEGTKDGVSKSMA